MRGPNLHYRKEADVMVSMPTQSCAHLMIFSGILFLLSVGTINAIEFRCYQDTKHVA